MNPQNADDLQLLTSLEKVKPMKLDANDPRMVAMVADVKKKQNTILKLKQIDYEDLQVVVQL